METSTNLEDLHERATGDDLFSCGICSGSNHTDDLKALPCLHTYCQHCTNKLITKDKLTCPICKRTFTLPPKGVSGFKSNIFVTRHFEQKATHEVSHTTAPKCTFSEDCDLDAIGRCVECEDYLCDNCHSIHKTVKKLKSHEVYSMDDILSGKVKISRTSNKQYCCKHNGQVLWFFCDTCGILICRDCTVIDHPSNTHALVNVDDIPGFKGKQLRTLSSRCEEVTKQVTDAIHAVDEASEDLTKALQKAKLDVAETSAKIKEQFLMSIKQKEEQLIDELTKIGQDHEIQINNDKDMLQSKYLCLKRALHISHDVRENGSSYDIAAVYTTLTDTLENLSDVEPFVSPNALADVKFVANDVEFNLPVFGSITTGRDLRGEWNMVGHFGMAACLKDAMGIASYPDGQFAVADYSNAQVKVFQSNGVFKHNIDVKQDLPSSGPRE
ncbi:E3 ubiquitin-protein ligase TRIM56-like [Amphiura filiformis]|uniref:E3 ubiquitin-protein ligase TRIM56-like n=1 Tax=Amphiura filiformis TaxID=82378 RepID=UPI003B220552